MAINIQRKEFIVFILSEMLAYMGLDVYLEGENKVVLIYKHHETTKVIRYTTFKRLLEFCGIESLADNYTKMLETAFFERLMDCKYFNTNIFQTELNRDIYKEAKEQNLNKVFTRFISYLLSNKERKSKDNYLFTTHGNMYIKSIDYFFNVNIEDTLRKQFDAIKDTLLSPEKVRDYIIEDKGENHFIPDGAIKECISEFIDSVEQTEGGLEKYLKEAGLKTVKEDIQAVYSYYVMRDYNLSY